MPELTTTGTLPTIALIALPCLACQTNQITVDGKDVMVPHPDVPPGTVFRYDPSDERIMSSAPSLGDPHERSSCFVATSTLPGGGAGMYARVPLEANLVCSYYSGVRLPTVAANRRTWAENEYTISLYSGARDDVFSGENEEDDGAPDTAIDVPHRALPWYVKTNHKKTQHCFKRVGFFSFRTCFSLCFFLARQAPS